MAKRMLDVPPVQDRGPEVARAAPARCAQAALADQVLDRWLREALLRAYDPVLRAPAPRRILRILGPAQHDDAGAVE